MAEPDLYALMQVHPRAERAVIDAAYRHLIRPYDNGSREWDDEAQALVDAHEILTDSSSRAKYDAKRTAQVGTIVGNYRILERIAEGGFGVTYRGEHLLTGMPVCVKHCAQVSAYADRILVKEASCIWNLKHYGLPVMRDLIRLEDGSLALIMSYEEGPTIEQVVRAHGPINPEHVAWITERVMNVLRYIHLEGGVVHGDVKPQNVILKPERHLAVLVDFGLAMVEPRAGSRADGHTPHFAPPEQLDGKPLLPGSDLYSLALTMIYAIGGSMEWVRRLEPPPNTPGPMVPFIRRLLNTNVLDRPEWRDNLYEEFLQARLDSFGRPDSLGLKFP